jgi:hypothetical protein
VSSWGQAFTRYFPIQINSSCQFCDCFGFFDTTLWQWRRLKVAENFLELLAPQTSKREGNAFSSIETYALQALLALASILQTWCTIGCSVHISQTSSATISAGDLNITPL